MSDTPFAPRRVVTGEHDGQAVFLFDGIPPNSYTFVNFPGFASSVLWRASPGDGVPKASFREPALPGCANLPARSGSSFLMVRFPPDSVMADRVLDLDGLLREQQEVMGDLLATFETQAPGMHRTATLDYGIVLDNEIWLELDNGAETHLRQGDVVVQGAVRHAWRNRSTRCTTMCFVMLDRLPEA